MSDRDSDKTKAEARAKKRSPNYPAINLEKAIELARKLYDMDRRQQVPLHIVLEKRWGYKVKASSAGLALAAAKSFGLIDVSGLGEKRQIAVSEVGYRILLNAPERAELLKKAALRPQIHSDIWAKYPQGLPQDDVLRNYLVFDKNFNEAAVDGFITQLKETISFSGLTTGDKISDGVIEAPQEDAMPLVAPLDEPPARPPLPGLRDFVFPLVDGAAAVLRVPHPMGSENFAILESAIKTFRTALVGRSKEERE